MCGLASADGRSTGSRGVGYWDSSKTDDVATEAGLEGSRRAFDGVLLRRAVFPCRTHATSKELP